MRNSVLVDLAAAGLVLAGTLLAGSGPASGSTARPAVTGRPAVIPVVRLGTAFAPGALRLHVGQRFRVTVDEDVTVSGGDLPGGCLPTSAARAPAGPLSVRCTAGGYLYTARHRGAAVLHATIRPRCAPGAICPLWAAAATLKVTVT